MKIYSGVGWILYRDGIKHREVASNLSYSDYQLSGAVRWETREIICGRCSRECSPNNLDNMGVCSDCAVQVLNEVLVALRNI